MRVVVNADDFGISHEANIAIAEGIVSGFISSTSIMVNAPAFEEAVSMAQQYGFTDKVGLHISLNYGKALTESITKCGKFTDPNGRLSMHATNAWSVIDKFWLPKKVRNAIFEETNKQIEVFLASGLSLMHFDTHHNIHFFYSVMRVLRKSAIRYGFSSVRIMDRYAYSHPLKKFYVSIYNKIFWGRFSHTSLFMAHNDYMKRKKKLDDKKDTSCEIMIHPFYHEGTIVDFDYKDYRQFIEIIKDDELISFNELYT